MTATGADDGGGAKLPVKRRGMLAMLAHPRGLWRFLRDPQAPRASKALSVLAVAYVVSPIDLLPEWLFSVVGYLDDLGMVGLALAYVAARAARYQDDMDRMKGKGEGKGAGA